MSKPWSTVVEKAVVFDSSIHNSASVYRFLTTPAQSQRISPWRGHQSFWVCLRKEHERKGLLIFSKTQAEIVLSLLVLDTDRKAAIHLKSNLQRIAMMQTETGRQTVEAPGNFLFYFLSVYCIDA